jgi:drug/metabolite transporter (DMT)-like permease
VILMPGLNRGVPAALGAALLFGASTPLAKLLLGETSPWLLAGLLYLGSGIGLALVRALQRTDNARLGPGEARWLAGAVLSGGVVAPVLLMWGLSGMPASGAALLLNAEAVFTALLAWFVFRENFDRRIALGMALIVAGAAVLSWPGEAGFGAALPALAVIAACLAWGIDNNLTRKVALADARYVAMVKGLAAGVTNTGLALLLGARLPELPVVGAAAMLGFLGYGISLVLFVHALRHLGTARTGAYFSTAPFAGAVVALGLLQEPVTPDLLIAGALMACGVWLHLTERHEHRHAHEAMEHSHEHEHEHDEHHRHAHDEPIAPGARHTHRHRHDRVTHSHPHYPDSHHRHDHW